MRAIGVVLLQLLAGVVFGLGLLSPLTPSEGTPRPADLLIFVGGPVLLITTAFIFSRRWQARLLATAEIGAILAATSWLLCLQYRTS